MAKTAKFDRQEVIDKATNLYWQKGFHATSMRNLQDTIDMRPGSIYAAFGNKNGLFKETLRNYTDISLSSLKQCQSEYESPIEALKMFVKKQVIGTQNEGLNGMCMLAKTIAELTSENQDLIDMTKSFLGEIGAEFVKVIEEAQLLGEVESSKNAEELATHVQIQIAGLRTYGKINNDKNKMDALINDIFTHYPFK